MLAGWPERGLGIAGFGVNVGFRNHLGHGWDVRFGFVHHRQRLVDGCDRLGQRHDEPGFKRYVRHVGQRDRHAVIS